MKIELIRKIPLFATLTDEEFIPLEHIFVQRSYRKNQVIFLEEDTGNYMYLVLSGKVKVSKSGTGGKETILAILNAGRLLTVGSLDELRQQYNPGAWVEIELLTPVELQWTDLPGVIKSEGQERMIKVQVKDINLVPALVNSLVQHKAEILRVSPQKTTLEDIYFKLQAEAREEQK